MHPYASDSDERKTMSFGIFLVSVGIVWGSELIAAYAFDFTGFELTAPSILFVAGSFYSLYNRHIWRWKLLQKVGLVQIPDLNGTWTGHGRSSHNGDPAEFAITVVIRQRWTSILICAETEVSSSKSLSASLLVNQRCRGELTYSYQNAPRPHAPKTMEAHRGTAWLVFRADGVLEGEYYTGRGRLNYGELHLRREES